LVGAQGLSAMLVFTLDDDSSSLLLLKQNALNGFSFLNVCFKKLPRYVSKKSDVSLDHKLLIS
jgi:hypothetical protein